MREYKILKKEVYMSRILQTPSLEATGAFDPQYDKDISFVYYDNQSIRNRAVITDHGTGNVVYDRIQDTMRLSHTIPANTLHAGKQYLLQVQVFDTDGNSSILSDAILIYCCSTPTFRISNIENGTIYKNASIQVKLQYEQAEGEPLKSYGFQLYDYQKTPIKQSGVLYAGALEYTFSALENHKTYYFKCLGETLHGFSLDTGFTEILVEYDVVPANVLFQVTNNKAYGYITLLSNITDIGYELKNDNYILEDGALTLRDNWLKYNDGFCIDGDFCLFIEAKKLPLGTFLKTESGKITLSIVKICNRYYCRLKACNDIYTSYAALPFPQLATENREVLTNGLGQRLEIINLKYNDDAFVVFELKKAGANYNLKAYFKENYLV